MVIKIKSFKSKLFLILILFLSILIINSVHAEDSNVNENLTNDDFDSIQDLIDGVNSGDSV